MVKDDDIVSTVIMAKVFTATLASNMAINYLRGDDQSYCSKLLWIVNKTINVLQAYYQSGSTNLTDHQVNTLIATIKVIMKNNSN